MEEKEEEENKPIGVVKVFEITQGMFFIYDVPVMA